jgi:hypothetical protein
MKHSLEAGIVIVDEVVEKEVVEDRIQEITGEEDKEVGIIILGKVEILIKNLHKDKEEG